MKPLLLAFLLFIVFSGVCGCTPSYRVKTDATNYREKLSIKKRDIEFFNGEYVGPNRNCFPPIENNICSDYASGEVYKASKELKMEEFTISISDTSAMASKVVKDMTYLTAAELTEQRGLKTFTVLNTLETSSCSSMYSVNSYGSVTGNAYSGTSYLSNDTLCANSYTMNVLLYDHIDDLKRGVLYRMPRNRLQPFKSLYIGTTPGLYEEYLDQRKEYLEQRAKFSNDVYSTGYVSERDAWKSRYDINGLSRELRNQYEIIEKLPYNFEDERESKIKSIEQQSADPIEKFKVTE